MRMKMIVGLLAILAAGSVWAEEAATKPVDPARLEWWRNQRFGMFIHWGPVSITGHEIGWSRGSQTPIEKYDSLYKKFNPTKFNADEWVSVAKAAGMKYIVITTKHHDGFCIFNTKQTDYNIMNSPFARDPVKELAQACRKQGIALGTYYSVCDWHHPDFPLTSPGGKTKRETSNLDRYNEYLNAQVKELITQYGPLSVLWFDVPQKFDKERGTRLINYVRSLQPDIIINNRTGAGGDYDTPEQRVGGFNMQRPWETCMTICRQWSWKPNDTMKSLQECLHVLIKTAGGDGNLLFNVGPMPTGEIEARQVERLKEMGAWLQKYGVSIYGTRGGPYKPAKHLVSTRHANTVYLHILAWPEETLKLPPLPAKVVKTTVLTGGKATVNQTDAGLEIAVPAADRQEIDTIVVLDLDKPALDIEPISIRGVGQSIATDNKAKASNIFQQNNQYSAAKAFDDDEDTRWATDAGTKQAWLEVDLGKPQTINRAVIEEWADRVQSFELQYKDGDEWKTFHKGKTIGAKLDVKFDPITAQHIRLNILEATEGPTITEFQLFGP